MNDDMILQAAKAHCDYFGGPGWWDNGFPDADKPAAIKAMRVALKVVLGCPEIRNRIALHVTLQGCDDSTHLMLDATPAELAFLRDIEAKSEEASTYNCMPTFAVTTILERKS